jgi:hypothetical protein
MMIALMVEAARTSETSVDTQLRTRQYISEDSELHTRRRENLKSHIYFSAWGEKKAELWQRDGRGIESVKVLDIRQIKINKTYNCICYFVRV